MLSDKDWHAVCIPVHPKGDGLGQGAFSCGKALLLKYFTQVQFCGTCISLEFFPFVTLYFYSITF